MKGALIQWRHLLKRDKSICHELHNIYVRLHSEVKY